MLMIGQPPIRHFCRRTDGQQIKLRATACVSNARLGRRILQDNSGRRLSNHPDPSRPFQGHNHISSVFRTSPLWHRQPRDRQREDFRRVPRFAGTGLCGLQGCPDGRWHPVDSDRRHEAASRKIANTSQARRKALRGRLCFSRGHYLVQKEQR